MIFLSVFSILGSVFVFVIGRKLPEPEVKIEVLHKPLACYRKSKYGDMLLVHYDGFLESNGTLFHSSRKDGDQNPVWFTLGIQEAMKGWDQGLQNMCTGERRKLTIPPALAYGKEGKDKPDSTLWCFTTADLSHFLFFFDSFKEMDINDDWKLSKEEVKEYLKKEFERHGYSHNDTHHELMVDDIFKNEDEDKDGFISTREFVYQHDEL
uniref:peptidylprolyl isomerase n=1 Tax=Tetraodon nigroviridis TaxID=99883 RepID=H3DM56_TETNG